MKKRLILITTSLAFLAAVFALYQLQAASAAEGSINVEKSPPEFVEAQLPLAEQNAAEAEIVEEVQALVSRWTEPLLQGPGWLHLVTQHDTSHRDKDRGTLPNGQPMPTHYVMDGWVRLNEEGLVVEAVTIQRDMAGRPVQKSVYRDNVGRNLTIEEIVIEQPPYPLRLDFGVSDNLAKGPEWYGTLERGETTLYGRPVLVVTMRQDYGEPLEFAGTDDLIVSTALRAYFDAESGVLLLHETIEVTVDGQERIVFQAKPLTVERGGPPVDVLALLEEVKP